MSLGGSENWSKTRSEDKRNAKKTIADLCAYLPNAKSRKELEEFRVEYERSHGPTDLTKRYTTTLPTSDQAMLLKRYPKEYMAGFPPFLVAWLRQRYHEASVDGTLDDHPDQFIRLCCHVGLPTIDEGHAR